MATLPGEMPTFTYDPVAEECKNAAQILKAMSESVDSFVELFGQLERERGEGGRKRGKLPTNQQDLLRAMLMFAAAGLDACVRQLVRDCLALRVQQSEEAREAFTSFIAKALTGNTGKRVRLAGRDLADSDERPIDPTLLGEALVADGGPEGYFVSLLIDELAAKSLQSPDVLFEAAEHLGIKERMLPSIMSLKPPKNQRSDDPPAPLQLRNTLAHQMDLDLSKRGRGFHPRNYRPAETMTGATRAIQETAKAFVAHLDHEINAGRS